MSDRWIVIPNWDPSTDEHGAKHEGFQHYPDRDPIWIKNYRALMSNAEYLKLNLRLRGILHGVWLLYAASGLNLGANPAQLGRMLGDSSVRTRDLTSLNRAGFITFSDDKPLARRYQHARLEKKKKEISPKAVTELDQTPAPDGSERTALGLIINDSLEEAS